MKIGMMKVGQVSTANGIWEKTGTVNIMVIPSKILGTLQQLRVVVVAVVTTLRIVRQCIQQCLICLLQVLQYH